MGIEDECHFLLSCSTYDALRQVLYNKARGLNNVFDNYGLEDKFSYLVNALWKDTSKYIAEAWSLRQSCLTK